MPAYIGTVQVGLAVTANQGTLADIDGIDLGTLVYSYLVVGVSKGIGASCSAQKLL
ncbi:MAG: hypothetical protein ACR2PS_07715 [Pseudomonadales bacterium]